MLFDLIKSFPPTTSGFLCFVLKSICKMEIEDQSGSVFNCLTQMPDEYPEEIDLTVKEGKREKTNAEIEADKKKQALVESSNMCYEKKDDFMDEMTDQNMFSNVRQKRSNEMNDIDPSNLQMIVYCGPKDQSDDESDLIQQFLGRDLDTPIEELENAVRMSVEEQHHLNMQAKINKQLFEGEKIESDFIKVVKALKHPGKLAYIVKGRRFNKHKVNKNYAVLKCYNKGIFVLLFFLFVCFCLCFW